MTCLFGWPDQTDRGHCPLDKPLSAFSKPSFGNPSLGQRRFDHWSLFLGRVACARVRRAVALPQWSWVCVWCWCWTRTRESYYQLVSIELDPSSSVTSIWILFTNQKPLVQLWISNKPRFGPQTVVLLLPSLLQRWFVWWCMSQWWWLFVGRWLTNIDTRGDSRNRFKINIY